MGDSNRVRLTQSINETKQVMPTNSHLTSIYRCALEWEYFANVIDRCLLMFFYFVTSAFFVLLVWFDVMFELEH